MRGKEYEPGNSSHGAGDAGGDVASQSVAVSWSADAGGDRVATIAERGTRTPGDADAESQRGGVAVATGYGAGLRSGARFARRETQDRDHHRGRDRAGEGGEVGSGATDCDQRIPVCARLPGSDG